MTHSHTEQALIINDRDDVFMSDDTLDAAFEEQYKSIDDALTDAEKALFNIDTTITEC